MRKEKKYNIMITRCELFLEDKWEGRVILGTKSYLIFPENEITKLLLHIKGLRGDE